MRSMSFVGRAVVRRLATTSASALTAAALLAASAAPAASQVTCSVVMASMRDGVKLATEVYRPTAGGRYPVILQRGPYNGVPAGFSNCAQPASSALAAQGYVVLLQDVRGTYRSEGQFRPVVQEGDDSYDAVEWAARQPWSTGKVGMMGVSYLALVQWEAAIKGPPHLVTIVPTIGPVSLDDALPYQTGVLSRLLVETWTGAMGRDQLWRKLTAAGTPPPEIEAQIAAYERRYTEQAVTPTAAGALRLNHPVFNSDLTPWYNIWLSHPDLDNFWKPSSIVDKFSTLSIPVLSIGAFYDLFSFGSVDGFNGMQKHAATPQARANARLILAGRGHAPGTNNYIGGLTFGADNNVPSDAMRRWFDHWLKGIDNGVMSEPAVKVYVMLPPEQGSVGRGFWASGASYPLPGTQTLRYYPGGARANSAAGGGILALTPAGANGSDQYLYDPANPVPSVGGTACCISDLIPAGPFDQRPVEIRRDVLVYTSATLSQAVPVIGDPTVTLTASSSAPKTAFTAKLVDVHPDGYAQIITEGVIETGPSPATSASQYTIRMTPTATVFKPGHKIRLEVSSSNSPHFQPSSNTEAPLEAPWTPVIATQTVLWGGAVQTSLNLPVAPITVPAAAAP
jgi:putative CocE/NonD family hydrolase